MRNGISRSPMFYVGDKYKLIREIRTRFPDHINRLIEPFVGGGSVMMNVDADGFILNDIDSYVIGLHQMLCGYVGREQEFYTEFYRIVDQYGLSLSYRENSVPQELRKAHPKTYFAKYNKEAYRQLKADFIAGGQQDWMQLYVLLIYGFNRMLRFNKKGLFNPVESILQSLTSPTIAGARILSFWNGLPNITAILLKAITSVSTTTASSSSTRCW